MRKLFAFGMLAVVLSLSELPTPGSALGVRRTIVPGSGEPSEERHPLIAVIDSGVDTNNRDLVGQIIRPEAHDFVDGDSDPNDLIGHGTEMAGIIAANGAIDGVCAACRILPLKVAGTLRYVDPATITQAVDYAVMKRAKIIYIGVGAVGADPALQSAIAHAEAVGILVVAPAGSQELTQTFFPAAFPTVLSVVGVDDSGAFLRLTNSGGGETVAARAKSVTTTSLGGALVGRSGSSVAAAHVAGVAGLLLSQDITLTATELRQIIRHATLPLSFGEWNEDFYFGVIDRDKALGRRSHTFSDVAVARLTLFPNKPLTGQANKVRVKVINAGNIAAGSPSVKVTWGTTQLTAVSISGTLNPGEERDVDISLPTATSSGDVALNVTAHLIGERELSNNTRLTQITYLASPEHDVDLLSGPLSEPVEELASISIPVTVRNRGNQDEPNVTLTAYINGLAFETQTFPLPLAGETTTSISWTIPPPPRPDVNVFRIVASVPSDVNIQNNTSFFAFTVGRRTDPSLLQYSDTWAPNEFVMDAPWRTILTYVPILFFIPEVVPDEDDVHVDSLSVWNYDISTGAPGANIFVDRRVGADSPPDLTGISVVTHLGLLQNGGMTGADQLTSFWHYIYRVPVSSIAPPAADGARYLEAMVEWSKHWKRERIPRITSRVLRVFTNQGPFPKFDPTDRYYDAHVHTIAEQTARGLWNADSARKNFGGPLAMLAESTLATGLVDPALVNNGNWNGDWSAFREKVVTTDHNVFYSADPNDDGTTPAFGPTSGLSGSAEWSWYRTNFGSLAGEEVALKSGSNQGGSGGLGHHFLTYENGHTEGPWHGGGFAGGVGNPNGLMTVLGGMKSFQGGFGYAAHPYAAPQVWPPEYYCEGIGLPIGGRCDLDNNCAGGYNLGWLNNDYLFKGLQVWNMKNEETASLNGGLDEELFLETINPFPGGPAEQRFRGRSWQSEVEEGIVNYRTELQPILVHNLKECDGSDPEREKKKFIRKLYMSGGTDAHGDFNYMDDVHSGIVSYFDDVGTIVSDAYARVRTYTLSHDRPPEVGDPEVRSQDAYKEGNTVLTDGPICKFNIDSDGRHNPPFDPDGLPHPPPRWHDATARWENAEGRIGGLGDFDGGRTVLIPGPDILAQWIWKPSATGEPSGGLIPVVQQTAREAMTDAYLPLPAPPNTLMETDYPDIPFLLLSDVSALMFRSAPPGLEGKERCITNPIWTMRADIRVTINKPPPDPGFPHECPFAVGDVTVSVAFPVSMTSTAGVFIRKLDGSGNSADPEFSTVPMPGWEEFDGVWNGKYTATNSTVIPCPDGPWDARVHAVTDPWIGSYVAYMTEPRELHNNLLNDIGWTFVTYCRGGICPPP